MLFIRDKDSAQVFGTISESELTFLYRHLESASVDTTEFYVDRPTLDALVASEASASLVECLQSALEGRLEAEIAIVEGERGGTAAAMSYDPFRFDEANGFHERATGELSPSSLMPLSGVMNAAGELEGAAFGDAELENDGSPGVADSEDGAPVEIAGRPLACVVCTGERFQHRFAQLHSGVATFFGVEWMGPTAHCYICSSCGYVHWFMR